jgi:purine-binding chemotaxis protein CheW
MNIPGDSASAFRNADTRKVVAAVEKAREYLTFRLGGEEYGIDILAVQEIRSYESPTRLANAPSFIKGVINLRGVIVPIVDLRVKLGCDSADYNDFTVVIVLNVNGTEIGTVVDGVSDVVALTESAIKASPPVSGPRRLQFHHRNCQVGGPHAGDHGHPVADEQRGNGHAFESLQVLSLPSRMLSV